MSFPSSAPSSAGISAFLSRRFATLAVAFAIALGTACPGVRAQTTPPTHPPYVYTFTDLGTLPGGQAGGSYGAAINASGDVAGASATSTGATHAVLFKQGKIIDLGLVPGASGSEAYGINGYDQITGALQFPSFTHAFLYSASELKDIGTAPGYDSSIGNSINDSGQIAGESFPNGQTPYPIFLYIDGKFTNIPGYVFGEGYGVLGNNINASGQVAGLAVGTRGYFEPAIFSGGSTIFLQNPGDPLGGTATAINDSGQATGWVNNPSQNTNAFLYSNSGLNNIVSTLYNCALAQGFSINAAGEIVGLCQAPEPGQEPFLYTSGQGMVNLNSLLPAGSKWLLMDATAINDKGQITGSAAYYINPYQFGAEHAYLLSPVFQSFSTLAAVTDIIGTQRTTFVAGGRFVLGAQSNGIYPLAETTILQLGGYHISIPPGSFTTQANGVYTYTGKIGNASVFAVLRPLGSNIYLFAVAAQGVAALPPSYPLNLTLTIGDDTGAQTITSNYDTAGLTEAEVCQDFGLNCGQ